MSCKDGNCGWDSPQEIGNMIGGLIFIIVQKILFFGVVVIIGGSLLLVFFYWIEAPHPQKEAQATLERIHEYNGNYGNKNHPSLKVESLYPDFHYIKGKYYIGVEISPTSYSLTKEYLFDLDGKTNKKLYPLDLRVQCFCGQNKDRLVFCFTKERDLEEIKAASAEGQKTLCDFLLSFLKEE